MNRRTLDELASGSALGALDADDTHRLDGFLAQEPWAHREVAAFIDTAAAFAAVEAPRRSPSTDLRERILATVKITPQKRPEGSPMQDLPPGFTSVAHGAEGWAESDVPGFRTKTLSTGPQPGYRVMLVSFDPGTAFREHEHDGIEELFMVSGHLHTEGRVLGPGDFMRGEMGTHHCECHSPDGCVALLICRPGDTASGTERELASVSAPGG